MDFGPQQIQDNQQFPTNPNQRASVVQSTRSNYARKQSPNGVGPTTPIGGIQSRLSTREGQQQNQSMREVNVVNVGPRDQNAAYHERNEKVKKSDQAKFDLIIPETTIMQILGADPIPAIDIELEEIQNELQRKLVSEILCEKCGTFPYMPRECKQCHKVFCQACQIIMQGNGFILQDDALLDQVIKMEVQNTEGGNQQSRRAQAMRYLAMNPHEFDRNKLVMGPDRPNIQRDKQVECCPNCNATGDFLVEVNPIVRNCVDFCEYPHKCIKTPKGEVKWSTIRELQKHAQYDECPKFGCDICQLPEFMHMTRSQLKDHLKRECPEVMILCQVCTKDFKRAQFNEHPCLKDFYTKKLKLHHQDVMDYLAERLSMFRRQKELLGFCRKTDCQEQFRKTNQENMMLARTNVQPAKCCKCSNITQGQEEAYFCMYCNENYCTNCLGYNLVFDLQEVENFIIQLQ